MSAPLPTSYFSGKQVEFPICAFLKGCFHFILHSPRGNAQPGLKGKSCRTGHPRGVWAHPKGPVLVPLPGMGALGTSLALPTRQQVQESPTSSELTEQDLYWGAVDQSPVRRTLSSQSRICVQGLWINHQ